MLHNQITHNILLITLILVAAVPAAAQYHTADQNQDEQVSLTELLRVVQLFNTGGLHCEDGTEDGYAPGVDPEKELCIPHDSDYDPHDWQISLSELLRLIQFFNSGGYFLCLGEDTEDGYCPSASGPQDPAVVFTAADTSGYAPRAIRFTNESVIGLGSLLYWTWDFGDGGTSNEREPIYTYQDPGVYDVTLEMTTTEGTFSQTQQECITLQESEAVDNIVVLAPETGWALQQLESGDYEILSLGSRRSVEELESGDFVVGRSGPDHSGHLFRYWGANRNLASEATTRSSLVISANMIEYVGLSDLIEQGSLAVHFTLDEGDFRRSGVPLLKNERAGVSVNLSGVTLFNTGGLRVEILSGSFDLDVDGEFVVDLGLFKVDRVRSFLRGSADLDVTVLGQVSYDLSQGQEISLFPPVKKTVAAIIAGVPVWLDITFMVKGGFDIDLGGAMLATTGCTVITDLGLGAEYRDAQWHDLTYFNSRVVNKQPSLALDAHIDSRVFIRPEIEVALYSTAAPYMALEPYVGIEGTFGSVPYDSQTCPVPPGLPADPRRVFICMGMDAILGFHLKILKWDLVSFERAYNVWSKPLWTLYPPVGPTAQFTGSPRSGNAPLTVSFTDQSTAGSAPITSRSWNFGDGGTSSQTNPSHTYSSPGTYNVSLTVTTSVGSDTSNRSNYIIVDPPQVPPTANFSGSPRSGNAPLTVTFTDQSTAGSASITSRSWSFGDGGTSSQANPSHTYSSPGTYNVNLTVTTSVGSNTETKNGYITVGQPQVGPTANFSASPRSGNVPLAVSFEDESTAGSAPITQWSWSFGDGGTSSQANPTHTYDSPGTYTVSLAVTTSVGSDTETKNGYITVDSPGEGEGEGEGETISAPEIVWQVCQGGPNVENGTHVVYGSDGGYVVAGRASANGGDVSGHHGGTGYDLWVTKIDEAGGIVWQNCLGGTGDEEPTGLSRAADGGYFVCAQPNSTDGDVSGHHGARDMWVVKLYATGGIEWQKCLGGSNNDWAYSVAGTPDGGCIVTGVTTSTNGDVVGHIGGEDLWAVKLTSGGTIDWQKVLGGSGRDGAYNDVCVVADGYVIAALSDSTDGDVSENKGGQDFWIVKLDLDGEIVWDRSYGGSQQDVPTAIVHTSDGGFLVAGYTRSSDGDVVGYRGGEHDTWVVKLDEEGHFVWQRCLGGSGKESASSLLETAGGEYLVVSTTNSTDGDVTGNRGGEDVWLVKLNASGSILWQRCLGGSSQDSVGAAIQTRDCGYLVVADTVSSDGDVSGFLGGRDRWLVKLEADEVCAGEGEGEGEGELANQTGYVRRISGGNLNGTPVDSGNYQIVVETGAPITGSIAVETENLLPGSAVAPLGATVTWGERTSQHWTVDSWIAAGIENHTVAVSKAAPSIPGTYYIVMAFAGRYSVDQVMSQTTAGMSAVWNDGNDVGFDWSHAEFLAARTNGAVYTQVRLSEGFSPHWLPATVVEVLVTEGGEGEGEGEGEPSSAPEIVWQVCQGGPNVENGTRVVYGSDGGYVVAGRASANGGDVSGHHGGTGYDLWVTKIDEEGGIVWQNCLGGTGDEEPTGLSRAADGGYFVCAQPNSTDGDVSGHHGARDMWVVKLYATGGIEWQKCLGGSNNDWAYSVAGTPDGGCIVTGVTTSTNGDVVGHIGGEDLWAVKLSGSGGITWQKVLGGTGRDGAGNDVCVVEDGYVIAALSSSTDGDVSENKGGEDFWVVKLDLDGEIVWDRSYGGSKQDVPTAIVHTSDGGFLVAGYTRSSDGDVVGYRSGEHDTWVVKLDEEGHFVWQRCLGGSGKESASSLLETAGGEYLVVSTTNSTDGDVTGNRGGEDVWLVKLDASGGILWQRCLGGSSQDYVGAAIQTRDCGYLVVADTVSSDGDVSGFLGGRDRWLVKLEADEDCAR